MKDKIRLPAEWEKQQAIILAIPHKQSDWKNYLQDSIKKVCQIASNIAQYQKVILIYNDDESIKFANKYIKNKNNIHYINIQINDTWCRDYMPISIIKNNKLIMLDFIFNGWGLKYASNLDNQASKTICKALKLKIKSKPFILEGGSIDTNGEGIIITTNKCLLSKNRNMINKQKIKMKLKRYLNINRILWLKNGFLAGDDTDCHVDNLARFINYDTIVYLACNDKNDIHFNELKMMEQELISYSKKYCLKIIPIPMPLPIYYKGNRLPASYINFLIINNAILIPIFNDKNDNYAISIFKKMFPDRAVIPIDSKILIRQGGGIHCISMQIPNN